MGQISLFVANCGPAALFRENDGNNFHRMLVIAEYLVSTMRVTVLSQSDKKIGAHRLTVAFSIKVSVSVSGSGSRV